MISDLDRDVTARVLRFYCSWNELRFIRLQLATMARSSHAPERDIAAARVRRIIESGWRVARGIRREHATRIESVRPNPTYL